MTEVASSVDHEEQLLLLIEVVMWVKVFEEAFCSENDNRRPDHEVLFDGLAHARNKGIHQAVALTSQSDV